MSQVPYISYQKSYKVGIGGEETLYNFIYVTFSAVTFISELVLMQGQTHSSGKPSGHLGWHMVHLFCVLYLLCDS
jgi:uncharacterized membrane protein